MTTDLSRRHLKALGDAFDFAQATDQAWLRGAEQSYANQVRIVHAFISKGVPVGTSPDALIQLFLARSWVGLGDIKGLWASYAKAGYVDTARPVYMHTKFGAFAPSAKNDFVALLPLEMAAAKLHSDAFQGLLDAGASIEMIPSRQWDASKPMDPLDPLDFVNFAVPVHGPRELFRAMTAKALGAIALEVPVFEGNVAAFGELLASGASVAQLPSKAWVPGACTPMDVESFIRFACPDTDLCESFLALITHAHMSALINRHGTVEGPAAPAMQVAPEADGPAAVPAAPLVTVQTGARLNRRLQRADI